MPSPFAVAVRAAATGAPKREFLAQPGRASHDVADLLAHRHRPLQPRQYPSPAEDVAADSKYLSSKIAARNGRAQADNAPEAMLSLVTNMAIPSGLKPSVAQKQRTSHFPYVVPA